MKIVHVILSGRYAGAEIIARDLALRQKAAGIDVGLIAAEAADDSFAPEIDRLRRNGVQFNAPARRLGNGLKRIAYLRKALGKAAPDVVVAHSILPSFYCRGVKLLGVKFRLASVLHSNSDFIGPAARTLRLAERGSYWLHDILVGVSEEACTNYEKVFGGRLRAFFIPNGIELRTFRFDESARQSARKDILDVDDSDLVLLQVGRISEQKQQLLTLRAAKRIHAGLNPRRRLSLIFAGAIEPSKYADAFFDAIEEPSAGNMTIRYLGARSDVRELLQAADVCLMPSAWEAHSIAAIEASASGIPFVMSDIPAFSRLSNLPGTFSFKTGVENSLVQAVQSALQHDGLRFERDLEEFSIDRCSNRYLKLLGAKCA